MNRIFVAMWIIADFMWYRRFDSNVLCGMWGVGLHGFLRVLCSTARWNMVPMYVSVLSVRCNMNSLIMIELLGIQSPNRTKARFGRHSSLVITVNPQ
jgi:hypothetical protein